MPTAGVAMAASAGEGSDTEAALRAKVAELERRLGGQAAARTAAAVPAEPEPIDPLVAEAFQAVVEELPELREVIDARLGTMAEQFVIRPGDNNKDVALYKRKYDVMGTTMNQQEMYMKAFNRAVRRAEKSKAVSKLLDLLKNGGEGLNRQQVRTEVDKLQKSSRLAATFFRDVAPQVQKNPLLEAFSGVLATAVLVGMTLLFCFCFFPPISPSTE